VVFLLSIERIVSMDAVTVTTTDNAAKVVFDPFSCLGDAFLVWGGFVIIVGTVFALYALLTQTRKSTTYKKDKRIHPLN